MRPSRAVGRWQRAANPGLPYPIAFSYSNLRNSNLHIFHNGIRADLHHDQVSLVDAPRVLLLAMVLNIFMRLDPLVPELVRITSYKGLTVSSEDSSATSSAGTLSCHSPCCLRDADG